ncbi:MAG: hypothetical protein K2P79_08540 [Sphingomonas sp.]|nr:hypothetical protein [Sphingomonas sp.]
MNCRIALPAALALIAGASAAVAQSMVATVKLPCLTAPEAEAMVTAIIPELVQDTGRVCARALPPTALVRQASGPFIDRYRAEADQAWPRAQQFVARVAGADVGGLLNSRYARPLVATLLTPAITRNIQPGDCAAIERIVALAQPLSPRSAAGLFVSVVQLADSKRQGQPILPICPPGRT